MRVHRVTILPDLSLGKESLYALQYPGTRFLCSSLTNNARRYPKSDTVRWNVIGHDRSRTDHRSPTDAYAIHDFGTHSKPNIVLNHNIALAGKFLLAHGPAKIIDVVLIGEKTAVRSDHHFASNPHIT